MYWDVLGCSEMFWDVLWDVLGCSVIDVLGCFGMFWDVLGCTWMYWNVLESVLQVFKV